MVQIEGVNFGYNEEGSILEDIDLHINSGECVLLCGESGCGKTTLTKLINGLIPHFTGGNSLKGKVTAAGLKVAEAEMYCLSEHIGSVFQNPKSQFFNIDSDSELVFGLENAGFPPEQIQDRLEAAIKDLDVGNLLGRNIFTMSGGEKQSLAFASVYAMNPDIFVLDEPTANLDNKAIDILSRQIIQVKNEGRTVIIAEHRLYFLMDLIDRAVYLKNGRIVKEFTKEQLKLLSEEERIGMGLRSLKPVSLSLPRADKDTATEGLIIKDLTCSFNKKPVFTKVNFSARRGEILGIIGNNGVGKTTLTRCLCGLLKETSGSVFLDGKKLSSKLRRKNCFYVMQDVNHQLFSDSVWNECELSDMECTSEKIESVLKAFDLLELKENHPMALSGGQKQRLAVATAVLTDKRVLIFDEPTSGLDYRHMLEVSSVIKQLNREGHIILIVSHDFEFLLQTCDKIMNMGGNLKEN